MILFAIGMRTYSRLPRNTSRDDDDVGTGECFLETAIGWQETFDFGRGSDMRKVYCHARSVYNIIESKLFEIDNSGSESDVAGLNYLCHSGVCLEKKGQGLADTTCRQVRDLIYILVEIEIEKSCIPAAPRTTAFMAYKLVIRSQWKSSSEVISERRDFIYHLSKRIINFKLLTPRRSVYLPGRLM